MKINKRCICAFAFSLSLFILLSIAYNELNYKSLEAELKELREVNSRLIKKYRNVTLIKENSIILSHLKKKSVYETDSFSEKTAQLAVTLKEKANENVIQFSHENKFVDLHKYSKFNPNFRTYMNWPPYFTIPSKNPTVSEVWETPIEANMSNWQKFNLEISKLYLYEDNSTVVEDMLHDLTTQKIVEIKNGVGDQLRLLATFENGGSAVFKPQRYPKDQEVQPNILYFSDFERHFSEIAAYHLDRILGFRRVPPTVGRKVSITGELFELADTSLSETIFYSPDGNYCFHGRCKQYCDTPHSFCGNPDLIEGSFSIWLLSNQDVDLIHNYIINPWRRTYVSDKSAPWETDLYYCVETVKSTYPFNLHRRLYDVIDCVIFDYLIGNMDRPDFIELLIFGDDSKSTMIHTDNGKGFGRADHDEESILSPLLQCCTVRLSTFNKLYSFYMGPRHLSDLMRESLAKDPLSPILTEPHLKALDRRVEKILEAIQKCIQANAASAIFLDDM